MLCPMGIIMLDARNVESKMFSHKVCGVFFRGEEEEQVFFKGIQQTDLSRWNVISGIQEKVSLQVQILSMVLWKGKIKQAELS